jgi:hypothetical protein
MPSFISSSNRRTASLQTSFFARGLFLIAIAITITLVLGHAIGLLYRPQPLSPTRSEIAAADQVLVTFGNSRFYSSIDSDQLAKQLTRPGDTVKVIQYSGGGWDSLHYYMLALLAKDVLRPGRDVVLIEVSPLSEDDRDSANKLGVIRPSVARQVAEIPGLPLESRLDILLGAVAGLYRYRGSIQGDILGPRLDHLADMVGRILERGRLKGPAVHPPPFKVITVPGRNYVVKEVQGDVEAFRSASREATLANLQALRFGGFKFAALQSSVKVLREHNLAVYLVQTPTSRWLRDHLNRSAAGLLYRKEMPDVAKRTGAILLDNWPDTAYEQYRFRDDMHMFAGVNGIEYFTGLLAQRLHEHNFNEGLQFSGDASAISSTPSRFLQSSLLEAKQ